MNKPTHRPDSSLEKEARTLRQANAAGEHATHRRSVRAQQEIDRPDHAKARPKRDQGPSNAGNDGGA